MDHNAHQLALWRDRGNEQSLRALLASVEPAVQKIAKRFAYISGMDVSGLVADARWAACNAFDDFDPIRAGGHLFPYVHQRINWRLMHITKSEHGVVRMPKKRWDRGLRPKRSLSLSDPTSPREKKSERYVDCLIDEHGTPLDHILRRDAVAAVQWALGQLNPRSAHIVRQRMDDQTLETIGNELGLTRERVRQLEKIAMDRLRVILLAAPTRRAPGRETPRPTSQAPARR